MGAKQNRVLNTTILLGAGAAATIPVSCVEPGRWGYRGRFFAPGDASLYASLRRKTSEAVARSLRLGAGHRSDQGQVWADLDRRLAARGVQSPTGAMRDFYRHHEDEIGAARAALAPVAGQQGAIVYLGGRWAGLDLLPGPELFRRCWGRLCAGYAADAVGRRPARGRPAPPAAVLGRLRRCPLAPAPAVALGRELRLAGRRLTGAALIVDDLVAHLVAFPASAGGGERPVP